MTSKITFKGNPLDLVGRTVSVGDPVPSFKVVSQDLKDVTLADYAGKVKVITSFPSLDTPVCDLQVREFNKRASTLSENAVILGVSMDLPFAQRKFCESNGIKGVSVLSDYKYGSFGYNLGLHIKQLNLLARAVLIVDADGVIRYKQVVPEMTSPPDFADAIKALAEVIEKPSLGASVAGVAAALLATDKVSQAAKELGWTFSGKAIERTFKAASFTDAKSLLDAVASIAEGANHHPSIALDGASLKITLSTRSAGGVTGKDVDLAKAYNTLVD